MPDHPKRICLWRFLLFASLLFPFTCGHHKDRDSRTGGASLPTAVSDTVSMCFYNVENLFDLHYDGIEYPEYRPGALGWNQQTFDKKLANITDVIAALDADIVALCEIENRSALEALRGALKKAKKEYPFMAIADLPNRTVTCPSLLSRYPIVRSEGFYGGDERGRRNILEADLDCGGAALKVFVNHWPSKAHPESQRLDMARALANRIARLVPGTDYVIAGDLNCDYDEWCKLHTEGLDDTKGVVGLNHIVQTIRTDSSGEFVSYVTERNLHGGDDNGGHYDAWFELPEINRFSRKYRGARETPDHFLIPRALFDTGGISYLDNSFGTYTWDGRLLRGGEPYRWQMRGYGKRKFHAGEGYSDHLPLIIRFVKGAFRFARHADSGSAVANPVAPKRQTTGGFERSMEGWMACGGIDVSLDSTAPASGRFCLRMQGNPQPKNCCAARTVLHWEPFSRSRWARVAFDIRGSGKFSMRMRSSPGSPWRYYNGESFASSGSARYLPLRFNTWKHVVLSFTSDATATRDIEIELRAGKEAPFCFFIDNVVVLE